jgi:hypothetical protein
MGVLAELKKIKQDYECRFDVEEAQCFCLLNSEAGAEDGVVVITCPKSQVGTFRYLCKRAWVQLQDADPSFRTAAFTARALERNTLGYSHVGPVSAHRLNVALANFPVRMRESALDLAKCSTVGDDRVYAQDKPEEMEVISADKLGRGHTMYTGAIISEALKGND